VKNYDGGKPYEVIVEDVMFLWSAGETDPEAICRRVGMKQDTVEQAFRRKGAKAPWIGTGAKRWMEDA
jgi:hypothetical protein